MATLFDFVDVQVAIDGVPILRDVTTSLPRGRLNVIAGASGSGKTSLLRLCNRLDAPTGGGVLFRGQDIAALDPRELRRRVAMVFQRPVLFPGTVRDNLQTADSSATEAEMLEALSKVDLEAAFIDRVADDLSGGEGQRVCLERALLCRPEVLLMDEPTASLHPAAVAKLENSTQHLRREAGMDVVWVTHDTDQIARLAQHLVVLEGGRVAFAGEPNAAGAAAALAALREEEPG